MSQSPGAGSAATAATAVRSSPCQELSVRGKGPRGGRVLWRAPSEGGGSGAVLRGAGTAYALRQSPDQSLPFCQGWGVGGGQRQGGCA